jgi:hypothetical protein
MSRDSSHKIDQCQPSEGSPVTEKAVYSFGFLDRQTGDTVTDPRMATEQAIRRLKGMALLESKRFVQEREIDSEGFYRA